MKLSILLLLQFFLLGVPASMIFAQFDVPHIIVFGTAETEAVPDNLLWTTSVKSRGNTVAVVADEHAKDVASVLDYLVESGLSSKEIKTSSMQLQENWVYRNNSRLQEGYYALTSISFKTSEFESYLNYWKQLSTFNNLTIKGVNFDVSNRIEIQHKTRIAAALKAKEKAISLSEALNSRIVEPLLIEEISGYSPAPRNAMMKMEMRGAPNDNSPISPGTETVRAQVKTVFRISGK